MIHGLFHIAVMNLGYAIELSLKQILGHRGVTKNLLFGHNISELLVQAFGALAGSSIRCSEDFSRFVETGLNSRYPSQLRTALKHQKANETIHFISLDHLHAYDDLMLQINDVIADEIAKDHCIGRSAIGELHSTAGRAFFHCNDHAHERFAKFGARMANSEEPSACNWASTAELWNYAALPRFRPWGPKIRWQPALEFSSVRLDEGVFTTKAAEWQANSDQGVFLSNAIIRTPFSMNFQWTTGPTG